MFRSMLNIVQISVPLFNLFSLGGFYVDLLAVPQWEVHPSHLLPDSLKFMSIMCPVSACSFGVVDIAVLLYSHWEMTDELWWTQFRTLPSFSIRGILQWDSLPVHENHSAGWTTGLGWQIRNVLGQTWEIYVSLCRKQWHMWLRFPFPVCGNALIADIFVLSSCCSLCWESPKVMVGLWRSTSNKTIKKVLFLPPMIGMEMILLKNTYYWLSFHEASLHRQAHRNSDLLIFFLPPHLLPLPSSVSFPGLECFHAILFHLGGFFL